MSPHIVKKLRAFYDDNHCGVPGGTISDEELLEEFQNLYSTVHDKMGFAIPLFRDDHWAKKMNILMSEIVDDIVLVKTDET